ncbi:MAG: tetratricopeptide repeat protein [Candidatus Obscuribacterales bacterium]|nr:tetratricopeptide repeat protein [Candidatus Obscuribacterales bacterium]
MDDETALLNLTMDTFQRMRNYTSGALNRYLQILPDSTLRGMAQHMIRQYMKGRKGKQALSDDEKRVLVAKICEQILNESIQKARKKTASADDEARDGAELFYRRALNQISRENFSSAERLLKRAVEISPDFVDAWEVLAEVLEKAEKPELAEKAKLMVRHLQQKL